MHEIENSLAKQAKADSNRFNLSVSGKPLIMGILNVTPDSFSDGGLYYSEDQAVARGLAMIEQGADIIDIGGESTRPGAEAVNAEQEMARVVPVIERIHAESDIPISIDTRKSEVAEKACIAGARMINDISGLTHDKKIAEVARDYGTYLILMHMRGTPATMQTLLDYDDLIGEISVFLKNAAEKAQQVGIAHDRIIIDPGIGFAKTVEHNFSIIKNISEFKKIGYPVMIGASRKSFIGKTLNLPVDDRLEGSLAAAVSATILGVDIIRTHDILPTVRAAKIATRIKEAD